MELPKESRRFACQSPASDECKLATMWWACRSPSSKWNVQTKSHRLAVKLGSLSKVDFPIQFDALARDNLWWTSSRLKTSNSRARDYHELSRTKLQPTSSHQSLKRRRCSSIRQIQRDILILTWWKLCQKTCQTRRSLTIDFVRAVVTIVSKPYEKF